MIDDFDLIQASFLSQYGIRLSRDLRGMKWDEFRTLLIGISPETPLGRIVAIRAETDKNILENFSPDQRRIRNEWMQRSAKQKTAQESAAFYEEMKKALIALSGGSKN